MQMLHLSLSPVWGMNLNMHFGTDLISSAVPCVNLQFRLCSSLQRFLCGFSHSLMPLFAMGLSSSRCLQAVLLYSICFDKPSGFNRFPKCLPSHSLSFWQPPVPANPLPVLSAWIRDCYFLMEALTLEINKEAAYRSNRTLLVQGKGLKPEEPGKPLWMPWLTHRVSEMGSAAFRLGLLHRQVLSTSDQEPTHVYGKGVGGQHCSRGECNSCGS